MKRALSFLRRLFRDEIPASDSEMMWWAIR